jgi:L-ribulokinase
MMNEQYVVGVDYGTDSVRSIIVKASNGEEVSSSVHYYSRWKQQLYCDAANNQFRQHPQDYIDGLENTIKECVAKAGATVAASIRAISIDTTGSTPVAVNAAGTPLALLPEFENNPNAMFVLWKDHSAVDEAAAINQHAATFPVNYLQYVGGIYSSEWFWAKLLHILKVDEAVGAQTASWVEHCDWIPFLLTGGNDARLIKRGVCSAGHKALWAEAFGGFPPNHFFASLHPLLDGFTDKLFTQTHTADQQAGIISGEWATRLGLPTDVVIGIGAFDAHMGAVGGQIQPYHLSKVMGTSTCDMMVVPAAEIGSQCVRGICGQVDGSIIPGMIGLEAGQSAFGDVYAWYRSLLEWPTKTILENSDIIDKATAAKLQEEISDKMISSLSAAAEALPHDPDGIIAMDWLNGRRTPDANQELKAAITGLSLGSDAPKIFRALVEATCFGARAIVERFIEEGIPVKGLIGLGGVAKKSPYIMQMMADVMNMPIRIHKSDQTCALGAAMFAATAAGIHPTVEIAMKAMGSGFEKTYLPNQDLTGIYDARYNQYKQLGKFLEQ